MEIAKKEKIFRLIYKCLKILVYSFWISFLALYLLCGGFLKVRFPLKYKEEILKCSEEYQLDSSVVFSVIKVESNFNKNAVSKKGAIGLMQIKKETAEYIAELRGISEYDLFDAETNVDFGCYYLRYLLNKFEVLDTALCAYNAGEGKVNLWLVDKKYSSDGKTINKIPFNETKRYVERTNKARIKYEKLLINIVDK